MYSRILYTAEAGNFVLQEGQLKFRSPTLRIPLSMETLIGRSSNTEEEMLCQEF